MSYDEFKSWLFTNAPSGSEGDFLEMVAMFGAMWLEHAALNSGESVHTIIEQCFSDKPVNSNLAQFLRRGGSDFMGVH